MPMKVTSIELVGIVHAKEYKETLSEKAKLAFLSQNPMWLKYSLLNEENQNYLIEHLCSNYSIDGKSKKLRKLLTSMKYLTLKLTQKGVKKLQDDFDCWKAAPEPVMAFLQQVLKSATPILELDPTQLPEQILARVPERELSQSFIRDVRSYKQNMWLDPLRPCLAQHGDIAMRVIPLRGDGRPHAVALSPDDCNVLVIVGNTLQCFELGSGIKLDDYQGKESDITAMTITRNGRYAVAASRDGNLTSWRLDKKSSPTMIAAQASAVLGVQPLGESNVITVSTDGTLKMWDIASNQEILAFDGDDGSLHCVDLLDEGSKAISGGDNVKSDAGGYNHLTLWDLVTHTKLASFGEHEWPVTSLAVVNNWLVSTANEVIKVWDLHSHELLHTIQAHDSHIHKIFPVGKQSVISASSDGTLKVWDLPTGENTALLRGHYSLVGDVAVTRNGQFAASIGWDQTLRIWDLNHYKTHPTADHRNAIEKIRVSPHGKWIVSASKDHHIKVWDATNYEIRYTLQGHTHWVSDIAISPNGRTLVSASWDKTLKFWSLETGLLEESLEMEGGHISALAFHPDEKRLLSGTTDGDVMIWDLKKRVVKYTLHAHNHGIEALAITPDGQSVFSVADEKTLKKWAINRRKLLCALEGYEDEMALAEAESEEDKKWLQQASIERMTDVAITHNAQLAFTSARNGLISVWDVKKEVLKSSFQNSENGISTLCVSSDGKYIATASGLPHYQSDNTVRLWSADTQILLAYFIGDAPMTACAFTVDNQIVVAGDELGRMHFLEIRQ